MLYDKARIFVAAGAGGDGCLSFRREAHVPHGGPDGGDGGHGGDVVLVCDDSLRDLQTYKRRAHYKATRARHGEGDQRHGAGGPVLEIPLPPGTQVTSWDASTHDLLAPGQRVVVARGGAGGRGNKRFASSTRQAPRLAERGLPGEEGWLDLRLKLLADVGLVGLPNAGKSSLLARMTRAAPKVAAYPFTTLEPVLGTLQGAERQLVIADIPGLIEGASAGAGLCHDSLAHVERTRLLVHVLELDPADGGDPLTNHAAIEAELRAHDPRLASLPRVLALSKADLVATPDAEAAAEQWRERLGAELPVLVTSSATGEGLDALGAELLRRVPLAAAAAAEPPAALDVPLAEHRVYRPAAGRGFSVKRTDERSFLVEGEGVLRLLARHDLDNDEALAHVEGRLRRMGVISALESAGFQPGDDVEIGGVVFELHPG
ncbi:MAG: GTPase ObgE [Solirubrobacteraceae bacterium]